MGPRQSVQHVVDEDRVTLANHALSTVGARSTFLHPSAALRKPLRARSGALHPITTNSRKRKATASSLFSLIYASVYIECYVLLMRQSPPSVCLLLDRHVRFVTILIISCAIMPPRNAAVFGSSAEGVRALNRSETQAKHARQTLTSLRRHHRAPRAAVPPAQTGPIGRGARRLLGRRHSQRGETDAMHVLSAIASRFNTPTAHPGAPAAHGRSRQTGP